MSLILPGHLNYPNGANPGYDPNHIASQGGGIRFSGVAGPYGAMQSLLNPAPPTIVSGTDSAPFGSLGRVVRFGPLNGAAYNAFTGLNETPTSMTFGAVFTDNGANTGHCLFATNGGSIAYNDASQVWWYGSSVSNAMGFWVGTNFVSMPALGFLATRTPLFVAMSYRNGGQLCGIMRNLQTGQIYPSGLLSVANSTIGTTTQAQYCVGGSPYGSFSSSNLAAIMYAANTFLGPAELLEWAQDPWAFWYPSKPSRLISVPVATPATVPTTTFNPSDKSAGVSLSGGNLIATSTSARGTVRAVDAQHVGKFYIEFTLNTVTNADTAVGLATSNLPLGNGLAWGSPPAVGCAAMNRGGRVVIDGNFTAPTWGVLTNGALIGVAVDLSSRLIWFRLGAAGQWNLSATADPVAGAGGFAISNEGGGFWTYPAATLGTTSEQVTANLGASAFSGTVPSGYTAGFPAGATVTTNALVTQVGVEEWFTTAASAQITQVAVEEWFANVAPIQVTQVAVEHWLTTTAPYQVTQVALEHWTSVAATYPTPAFPEVMLSASRAGIGSVVLNQDNATRDVMVSDVGTVGQTALTVPTPPISLPTYHITAGRAGVPSAVVTELSTRTFQVSFPAVLTEGYTPPSLGAISVTLGGVTATGVAGVLTTTIPPPTLAPVIGVAATTAFGVLHSTDIEPLQGRAATGVAAALLVFPGPVAFPAGVYATGQPGAIFAIAGGVVEKFIFFMAGPF